MKLFFQNLLACLLVLEAMFVTALACGQPKTGGTCTYEGLECPTALNQYLTDSMAIAQRDSAYQDLEIMADSLQSRITELETQLAGCEFSDHSKIADVPHYMIFDDRIKGTLTVYPINR